MKFFGKMKIINVLVMILNIKYIVMKIGLIVVNLTFSLCFYLY